MAGRFQGGADHALYQYIKHNLIKISNCLKVLTAQNINYAIEVFLFARTEGRCTVINCVLRFALLGYERLVSSFKKVHQNVPLLLICLFKIFYCCMCRALLIFYLYRNLCMTCLVLYNVDYSYKKSCCTCRIVLAISL